MCGGITSPTQEPAASSRDASGWSEPAPTPRPPMQLEGRSRVELGPFKGLWQLGKGTAIQSPRLGAAVETGKQVCFEGIRAMGSHCR